MQREEKQMCPDCFQRKMEYGTCTLCGFEWKNEKKNRLRLAPFTRLKDRYVIGRILGNGGFGITYKAYDTQNQCCCAVKEFVPLGLVARNTGERQIYVTSANNKEDFEHGKKRFMEEAEILKKLDSLPEVAQVKDYFTENGTVYFVMEYIQGVNLLQLMKVYGGCIPLKEALSIVCMTGRCLEQVHTTANIFHRDISPDNIMVTGEGQVKLIDFGNAKYLIGKKSQNLTAVVKHGYAPPEQYSSTGKQGSFTDVYALAATLYYIVTGVKIPNPAERYEGKEYKPLSEMNPGIPLSVSEAVERALILNSRLRTQTMREFVEELDGSGFDRDLGKGREERGNQGSFHERSQASQTPKAPYVKLCGQEGEIKWNLPQNEIVTIGRSEIWSDIVPGKDVRVSKKHCELSYDSIMDCFCIMDISKNGTFARGKRLEKGKVYDLQEGETFEIGRNIYVMEVGLEE